MSARDEAVTYLLDRLREGEAMASLTAADMRLAGGDSAEMYLEVSRLYGELIWDVYGGRFDGADDSEDTGMPKPGDRVRVTDMASHHGDEGALIALGPVAHEVLLDKAGEGMNSVAVPLLYTRPEACTRLRMGRSKLDELIRQGEIRSVKIGRSRRIPVDALDEYVRRLVAAMEAT